MIRLTGFLMAFLLLGPCIAKAEQRCSKISGTCFEWPLVPDGSKLQRKATTGVWSKPDGDGPFPAIILAESCGGSTEAVNKDWPKFFNALGYATYTPRLLEPMGHKYCPGVKFVVANENRAEMIKTLFSALDEMGEKSYVNKSQIGIIGYSLGSILIRDLLEVKDLVSSTGLTFNKSIMLYGTCTLIDRRGPQTPTLIIQAEMELKSHKVKSDVCNKVKDAKLPNLNYVVLEGAYHAFDDSSKTTIKKDVAGTEMLYNKEATDKAKDLIKSFLSSNAN